MNNSEGAFTAHGKNGYGSEIKCNMQEKKPELLQHFKGL
jgi:hypothetical protein